MTSLLYITWGSKDAHFWHSIYQNGYPLLHLKMERLDERQIFCIGFQKVHLYDGISCRFVEQGVLKMHFIYEMGLKILIPSSSSLISNGIATFLDHYVLRFAE